MQIDVSNLLVCNSIEYCLLPSVQNLYLVVNLDPIEITHYNGNGFPHSFGCDLEEAGIWAVLLSCHHPRKKEVWTPWVEH